RRVVWVMFLLPGSLFASVLYAESLALLWLLLAYAELRRGHAASSLLAGFLAGLTRINALAAVPMLALSAWRARGTSKLGLLAALGPVLGLAAFMAYTQHEFGDAFAYMRELRTHRFAGQGWAVAIADARALFDHLLALPDAPYVLGPTPLLIVALLCVLLF